jgi:hypothetical protein
MIQSNTHENRQIIRMWRAMKLPVEVFAPTTPPWHHARRYKKQKPLQPDNPIGSWYKANDLERQLQNDCSFQSYRWYRLTPNPGGVGPEGVSD